MNIKNYFYFVLCLLLAIGCANCDQSKLENRMESPNKSIKEIALEKFGKEHKIIKNNSKTYAICLQTIRKAKPPIMNNPRFFVYDFEKSEIIFEDKIVNGNVNWESDSLVSVSRIPGMLKKDSENKTGHKVYSFDVKTKKKIYN
jgi:hypothetical protein